jgi:hypothetical protein
VNAQLKVHSGGTVTVGTGTGSTTSTLNLYSTNNSTIYSRATFTVPSSVAIKSEVYRTDAIPFLAIRSGIQIFRVMGNGDVWSYTNYYTSDSTLKENFESIVNAKEKLLKLKGIKYNFKDSENKNLKHLGFLAQDVEKVFPEIVSTTEAGVKGIAYAELIPVIIEALKELQVENDQLSDEISKLKSKSNDKSATYGQENGERASLNQNIPNPFSSNTRIEMVVPSSVSRAVLYIYNMQGEQIKQLTINERGNSSVTIEGHTLKAGMYLYTLITDGKEVDTKKMILTK